MKRDRRRPRDAPRGRRCFTLIELLVVVAIIAVLSGLLFPVFLQARERARRAAAEGPAQEPAIGKVAGGEIALPTGPAPVIDAVDLRMSLAPSYHRIGVDVTTRYQVDCAGRILFRHPGGAAGRVVLAIPFPEEIVEARDVTLRLSRPGSDEASTPDSVVYDRTGIYCPLSMEPGQLLAADVGFTALGRERFDYGLPPARQLRSVAVTLQLARASLWTIPDEALQPSSATRTELRWEFRNLVSDRQISVLIPAAQAPVARVVLLLQLMAVAVLLFGAGIWFLSEQTAAGRLDRFRLGHFLLLALTYSLFFVLFAVFEFHGTLGTPLAMGVSALFSLPLLVLHVSRVLDLRFALTRVIPLAVFTVGLVVVGVYGGALRDYIFIGAAVVTMGYVTVGYPAWAAGREQYRQERDAAYSTRRVELIDQVAARLGARVAELSAAEAQAGELLKRAGPEEPAGALAPARARLERARDPAGRLVKEYEDLARRLASVPAQRDWDSVDTVDRLERDATSFRERLEPYLAHLLDELAAFRASLTSTLAPAGDGRIHCMACGRPAPRSRFCPECGHAHPVPVTCAGCGDRVTVPVHLLAESPHSQSLCCSRCGTRLPALSPESDPADPGKSSEEGEPT